MAFYHPVFSVYGNTGKISHMLIGAGQLIKQGGLAAVLVAHKRKGKYFTVRKGIFLLFCVVFSAFSVSGMGGFRDLYFFLFFFRSAVDFFYLDFFRIIKPDGQFVSVEL